MQVFSNIDSSILLRKRIEANIFCFIFQNVNFNLGNSNFILGNTNFNLGNSNFIVGNANFNLDKYQL